MISTKFVVAQSEEKYKQCMMQNVRSKFLLYIILFLCFNETKILFPQLPALNEECTQIILDLYNDNRSFTTCQHE